MEGLFEERYLRNRVLYEDPCVFVFGGEGFDFIEFSPVQTTPSLTHTHSPTEGSEHTIDVRKIKKFCVNKILKCIRNPLSLNRIRPKSSKTLTTELKFRYRMRSKKSLAELESRK